MTPEDQGQRQKRLAWLGPFAVIATVLLAKGKMVLASLKFLIPILKFLKIGKILTTGGSMFLSMWAYATIYGWWFAAGLVVSILIHEMGHVFVAWRQGVPVSAPVFIPFMGALILQKEQAKSAWAEAMIAIGGPLAGFLAALLSWGIYEATGNQFFLAIAFVGFFLNLFNLAPVFPLDGGWIVGAISPRLWLVGMIVLVAMFFMGYVRNPLLIILIVMGLPHVWHGLRSGEAAREGQTPATPRQKWIMGGSYLGLCAVLALCMAFAHEHPGAERREVAPISGLED